MKRKVKKIFEQGALDIANMGDLSDDELDVMMKVLNNHALYIGGKSKRRYIKAGDNRFQDCSIYPFKNIRNKK